MLNWEELDVEIALLLEEELVPVEEELVPADETCTELSAMLCAELPAPAPEPEPPPQACSRLKHDSHKASRHEILRIFIATVAIPFSFGFCTNFLSFPRSRIKLPQSINSSDYHPVKQALLIKQARRQIAITAITNNRHNHRIFHLLA